MNKDIFIGAGIAIIIVVGASVMFAGPKVRVPMRIETANSPAPAVGDDPPQQVTLEGEYTCLPHIDSSGPQTLECALGLKTDDGSYYALDTNLLSSLPPTLKTGDRLRANGILTPIERLSTDHWRKYNVKGIFSVTDSLEKR